MQKSIKPVIINYIIKYKKDLQVSYKVWRPYLKLVPTMWKIVSSTSKPRTKLPRKYLAILNSLTLVDIKFILISIIQSIGNIQVFYSYFMNLFI